MVVINPRPQATAIVTTVFAEAGGVVDDMISVFPSSHEISYKISVEVIHGAIFEAI